MVPILGVYGSSGSGKTTLLCKIISCLAAKGLKIGVIKHHGHSQSLQFDQPGKDTDRLFNAKAIRAVLVHMEEAAIFARSEFVHFTYQEIVQKFLGDLDLVLVEGYQNADLNKIEVVAPGQEPILARGGQLLALVRRGGKGIESGLPVLNADDPPQLANIILDYMNNSYFTKATFRVSIVIDDVLLQITPFVAKLFEQTIRGMLSGLKGSQIAQARHIEVKIG